MKISTFLLLLCSSVAFASEPKTFDHTTNIPNERYRLSLTDASVNFASTLSVGTHPLWWSVSLFSKTLSPNLYAKGSFTFGKISVSPFARIYMFDFKNLTSADDELNVKIIPAGVTTSFRSESLDVHLEAEFIAVLGDVIGDIENENLFDTAIFSNSARARLSLEWKLADAVSLWGYLTTQFYQGPISGTIYSEFGGGSSVKIRGNLKTDNLEFPTMGAAGVAARLGVFNVRLGAGYGRVFVPDLGLITPFTFPFPEIDLYFLF